MHYKTNLYLVAKLHHFSQNSKQNAFFYIIICVKTYFATKGVNLKLNYNAPLALELTIISNLRNLIPIFFFDLNTKYTE